MSVARLWRTRIDPDRAAEYESFAREVSLPMFERQPGCDGVLMMRSGPDCLVATFWRDAESAAALAASPAYRAAVASIAARGFLAGEATIELFDVHLSNVALGS